MRKTLLLALLGCGIIASAAYANIHSVLLNAVTADTGIPTHALEILDTGKQDNLTNKTDRYIAYNDEIFQQCRSTTSLAFPPNP